MIEVELIRSIADALEREGADEAAVSALRSAYPALHFTLCSDEDVPPRLTPVLAREGFNVYLVDAGEHCVKFTAAPEQASGLVFATVSPDE